MYSVLQECEFESNTPFNPDLFQCRLIKCQFRNQNIERATWRETTFVGCAFLHCNIERSTFQHLEFDDCILDGTDLSQLTVTDIHFSATSLEGVVLDPDYLGTYTFSNSNISATKFSYRSQKLDFSASRPDDFIWLAKHFETQQRWSEAFNILGLLYQFHGARSRRASIEHEWLRSLTGSLKLEIPADSAENVRRLFKLARHYLRQGLLSISGTMEIVANCDLRIRTDPNGLIAEEMASGTFSLLRAIETLPNLDLALSIDSRSQMTVRFQVQVESEDEDLVRSEFAALLDETAGKCGIPFQIRRVGFGSVVIEAATWFLVVIMMFRAARAASNTFVEIRLILKAHDRFGRLIETSSRPEDVLNIIDCFRETLPKEATAMDLLKEEVREVGEAFHSLTKSGAAGGGQILGLLREIRIFIQDFRQSH